MKLLSSRIALAAAEMDSCWSTLAVAKIEALKMIIDLGPEGGYRGGQIIAEGTPEQVAANPASHTGRFLAPLLKKARK
jgi:hypothetical protein